MKTNNDQFPLGKAKTTLIGPAGKLEVMTTRPLEGGKPVVGIVCHPNPLFGGTMNNKVVTTIVRAFEHLGVATVRFNFRGVGESEGEFDNAVGECEDLRAVISWVQHALPDYQLWLAGFSFGTYITASLANQMEVARLVSVAPTVVHHDFTQLTHIRCPWLVIQGDQDEVVSFNRVVEWTKQPPAPLKFIVMKGAGHFFHGRLVELREHVERWFRTTIENDSQ